MWLKCKQIWRRVFHYKITWPRLCVIPGKIENTSPVGLARTKLFNIIVDLACIERDPEDSFSRDRAIFSLAKGISDAENIVSYELQRDIEWTVKRAKRNEVIPALIAALRRIAVLLTEKDLAKTPTK